MTYGEVSDRFQRTFGTAEGRFNGEMVGTGGSTFRITRLKMTKDSPEIPNALVTLEKDRTTVVNLENDEVKEFMFD